MPTLLKQLERHASGSAAFEIRGPATRTLSEPQELTIAIVQPGPTELYLDPRNPDDPWTTSMYWFHPLEPHRQGDELWLDIDLRRHVPLARQQAVQAARAAGGRGRGGGDLHRSGGAAPPEHASEGMDPAAASEGTGGAAVADARASRAATVRAAGPSGGAAGRSAAATITTIADRRHHRRRHSHLRHPRRRSRRPGAFRGSCSR